MAMSPAGKLCGNLLGYALELVKKAKLDASQEYMQLMTNLMVLMGKPHAPLHCGAHFLGVRCGLCWAQGSGFWVGEGSLWRASQGGSGNPWCG